MSDSSCDEIGLIELILGGMVACSLWIYSTDLLKSIFETAFRLHIITSF